MEFKDIINKRMAVRKFSNKEVDDKLIEEILEMARFYPSAKNMQPQLTFVVKSKEGIASIDKASPCRYNAPVVLLVCSSKDKACRLGNDSTYLMDGSIYGTFLMMSAVSVGLDTIWIEYMDKDIIKKEFNLSDNVEPICLLPIGYRSEDCPTSPGYLKRNELKDTVKYI